MSNNNNMREQFPGIAKADTILDAVITLGYITLIGIVLMWGWRGIFALILPQSKIDDGDDVRYGALVAVVLVMAIVAVFGYFVFGTNNTDDRCITILTYLLAIALGGTLFGFVCAFIARLLGKDCDWD